MNNNNLILSIILSIAIITGWQYFYERPRLNKLAAQQVTSSAVLKKEQLAQMPAITLEQALVGDRVQVENPNAIGSINLTGARIDDLIFSHYNQEVKDQNHVRLFSPSNTKEAYFAEVGWLNLDDDTTLPNSKTLWKADHKKLLPNHPVTLSWKNSDNVEFFIKISIDEDFMFDIEQTVKNSTSKTINLGTYCLLNQNYNIEKKDNILHRGPIAVINNELKELNYSQLKEDKKKVFQDINANWVGISDKYWLGAFIPNSQETSSVNFNYQKQNSFDKFQTDIISEVVAIAPGQEYKVSKKLFAGAKQVKLLDGYAKKYDIKLFDRAIDFGWLYIITKPLFYLLSFLYGICGNFGLSIILATVLIKGVMFGLSTKAGKSMKRLKELQPEMERLKNKYGHDKIRFNQEVLNLYKKEKVNPMSGCLPILIQLPIFFAIYKVLYVTIEMRHAPFYGWIQDLSAADPTSVINLFGLLPFTPPSFLHIGVLPIMMSLSMFVQQQISGTSTAMDPMQAQVIKFLPLIFLFTFASFPAGLLIYWTWSNLLSIVQQLYINKFVK